MKKRHVLAFLLLPAALIFASLFVGRFGIDPAQVFGVLFDRSSPAAPHGAETLVTIVMDIRLPRALMAALVGAGLAASGAAYQGMFRNPLVSPDILGVTAASGFGAALALLGSNDAWVLQAGSFAFGIVGVGLTYGLARVHRATPVLMLVLSGVVVGAFFTALLGAVKYLADPDSKLPAITYWLLGSLEGASQRSLLTAAPSIVLGGLGLFAVRWQLDLLAMGEEEARTLGLHTEWLKGIVIVCTTLITASAVSVCGMVGWVGLVVPHLARMVAGPGHRRLLPASMALGASFLLIVDAVARTASASEIPLGILTAVIGAPFFVWLLRTTQGRWN